MFFGNHDFSIGTFTFYALFMDTAYWRRINYDYEVLIFGAIVNFAVGEDFINKRNEL